ncbi:MAG: hypothetical protein KAI43_07665 [Candidatus Aureabacteria bacterium]|nr:hypothetical protein [Candidatus Auribacterota bacterium]
MNDFERLENLSVLFRTRQQEYWRTGDREKPHLVIAFFYAIIVSLIILVLWMFKNQNLAGNFLIILSLILQIIMAFYFGRKYLIFRRLMKKLNNSIIQTKDDIVSINRIHLQTFIDEVKETFESNKKEFAEFLCIIIGFFGFAYMKNAERSSNKVILPLIDRWNIPVGTNLNAYTKVFLDIPIMKSLPKEQKVGILAILRENAKIIAGLKTHEEAGWYDFENSIYLLKALAKETQFSKHFSRLVEQFID